MSDTYPVTKLWLTVDILLKELDLPYKVSDVQDFGWVPAGNEGGPQGAVFVTVATRDAEGSVTGSARFVRWLHFDKKYTEWDNPLTEPVID